MHHSLYKPFRHDAVETDQIPCSPHVKVELPTSVYPSSHFKLTIAPVGSSPVQLILPELGAGGHTQPKGYRYK